MSATDSAYENIGPTAHVTAYAWHRLGMPYAHLFATPTGAALYWSFGGTVGWLARMAKIPDLLGYLEFRHRMLGAQMDLLNPDLVIELGAGLSHRGLSWALDRAVPYIEIDLPHMSAAKRGMLDRAPRRVQEVVRAGGLELRSTDILAPEFADELAQLVAGSERALVVSEGMLDYFDFGAREALLTNLARGLRGVRAHYLTDLQCADRERRYGPAPAIFRAAIQVATRGNGAQRPFRDREHVDRFFKLAGFDHGVELEPRQLADREPRLHELRSPTTIWLATLEL